MATHKHGRLSYSQKREASTGYNILVTVTALAVSTVYSAVKDSRTDNNNDDIPYAGRTVLGTSHLFLQVSDLVNMVM